MKTLFETRIYMSIPLSVYRPANTRIINHASAQTGKLGTQLWLLNERMPPLLFNLFWLEWARKKKRQRINTTSRRYFWDPSPGLEERQVSIKHCFIQWQQQRNLAKAETVADKVSLSSPSLLRHGSHLPTFSIEFPSAILSASPLSMNSMAPGLVCSISLYPEHSSG